MAKVAVKKYTPGMEAAMTAAQPLNQARCVELAERFNLESKSDAFSVRSVTAKAVRMGLDYERKVAVSKTGDPVEKKNSLVTEISQIVGFNLATLDKAGKTDLQRLRDYLAA